MKSIQKMEAGKYYLIESKASANSVYFETDAVAKLFFRYCDYYLKDYLHVEEYALNKDGWTMLIKVRSIQTIRKYYNTVESKRKSKVNKTKSTEAKEIWWILSERMRLFISTYVRMSNKIRGREGSLVRRKYGRYQFDNLKEAKNYVAKIRSDQHELKQSKEKYRGIDEHFEMGGTIITNPLRSSIWIEICEGKERIEEVLMKTFGTDTPVLQRLGYLVAPKLKLEETWAKNIHPTHLNPKPK